MNNKKEIKRLAKAIRKKAHVEFVQSFRIAKWFVKSDRTIDSTPYEVDRDIYLEYDVFGYPEPMEKFYVNGIPLGEIWDW